MLSGMAALNGGLGATGLTNGTAGTMDALTQAYSGIQQYAAAALPTLYSQSLLQQQSAAGSQKEGRCARPGPEEPVEQQRHGKPLLPLPLVGFFFLLRNVTRLHHMFQSSFGFFFSFYLFHLHLKMCFSPTVPLHTYLVVAAAPKWPGSPSPKSAFFLPLHTLLPSGRRGTQLALWVEPSPPQAPWFSEPTDLPVVGAVSRLMM